MFILIFLNSLLPLAFIFRTNNFNGTECTAHSWKVVNTFLNLSLQYHCAEQLWKRSTVLLKDILGQIGKRITTFTGYTTHTLEVILQDWSLGTGISELKGIFLNATNILNKALEKVIFIDKPRSHRTKWKMQCLGILSQSNDQAVAVEPEVWETNWYW